MPGFLFGDPVTVIRGEKNLRTGEWVETSRHQLSNCAVDQTSGSSGLAASNETSGTSDTLTVDMTVFAPYGSDVLATDRVELADGDVYDVVGKPVNWKSPFTGWAPGMVIQLVHHKG